MKWDRAQLGCLPQVLLSKELIWSEAWLNWGWLHFLRVLLSLRRRGIRKKKQQRVSAFTESYLDLQFNSARRKKDGMGSRAEAECHRVTGFLSSSDCSKGSEAVKMGQGKKHQMYSLSLWREQCLLGNGDCITDLISRRSWLGLTGIMLHTAVFSNTSNVYCCLCCWFSNNLSNPSQVELCNHRNITSLLLFIGFINGLCIQ